MLEDGAISEARRKFTDALQRGDAAGASAMYAADARLLAPSAELIEGRDAIAAFWQAGLEAGIAAVELDALDVEQNDAVAYEIGRYALRLEPEAGGQVIEGGKYVHVHERQPDGAWLRVVEMFNPDAPPALVEARPDEKRRMDVTVQIDQ